MSKTKTTKPEGPAENIAISDSFRQAIETRYYGPTNSRGSRIRAKADAGSLTVPYDYSLNPGENHAAAAEALIRKLGWVPSQGAGYQGTWHGGQLPSGDYAWTFAYSEG